MIHELFRRSNGWLYVVFGGNMKTDTMIFKWDESHEKRRCKYTLHAVCGYGMVFERKIKNKKKTRKSSVLLLYLYSMKRQQTSLAFKRNATLPSHVIFGLRYTEFLKYKHFFAPSLKKD